MKRTLKSALLAAAAAGVLGLVFGMPTPSLAQQDTMRAAGATSERVYQPADADREAATRNDDADVDGDEAYAYVPFESGGPDSCASQDSYGQGADYSACGGE